MLQKQVKNYRFSNFICHQCLTLERRSKPYAIRKAALSWKKMKKLFNGNGKKDHKKEVKRSSQATA